MARFFGRGVYPELYQILLGACPERNEIPRSLRSLRMTRSEGFRASAHTLRMTASEGLPLYILSLDGRGLR
ncbi:MAG: hypothetical protein COS87_00625 [Chloroflexi bacterium CG07_land_8_20_14_0_80_45_17]|nr:MAG: hypothetical protein COX14_01775 [Chloroflexi bacterium CG23_combo_of_CG06-09_8_20_14_all_45_10]PIU56944.1 MAG: hypothetical protein COS87_00625 [Chloroflexi bacterium CG07_land_8_20_14_0_80_45_17]